MASIGSGAVESTVLTGAFGSHSVVNSRDTYEVLERLANLMRASERRAGAHFGLQPVHLHALSYLNRCNRYSDNLMAITDYLGITKGTASQTLRLLQDKGMIAGTPDARDGRKVHLRLTGKGERILAEALPPSPLDRGLSMLGQPAAGAVCEQMQQLLRTMQRANDLKSFGVCGTCQFLRRDEGKELRCGLTSDELEAADVDRICREHSFADDGPVAE